MNNGEAIDGSSRFYNLDGNFYNSNTNMPEETRDAICFGSSHGWIVLLNSQLEFMLSTPFLDGIQLPLPPLKTFPDIHGMAFQKGTNYTYNIVDHFTLVWETYDEFRKVQVEISTVNITSVKQLASMLSAKAALSSGPTCNNKDKIGVMVMYVFGNEKQQRYKNLAFCTTSDHSWTKLEERRVYLDLVSCDDEFYVLMKNFSVDVWEFGTASIPVKKMKIKPAANALFTGRRMCYKLHMIKTAETGLLLVLVDPKYRRSMQDRLHVFKLEGTTPKWEEMKSIGSNALVLGS